MKRYCTRIAVKPTVFTEDTVYQAWVNTDTKTMRLLRIHLQLDSADAGGNANSIYGFQRIQGTPSASGADVIVPTRYDNNVEPSMMLCYRKQSGLVMNGVAREGYFLERSVISKSTGSAANIQFDHEDGFYLLPGEGLCIFADNTVVDGSGIYGMLEWGEE